MCVGGVCCLSYQKDVIEDPGRSWVSKICESEGLSDDKTLYFTTLESYHGDSHLLSTLSYPAYVTFKCQSNLPGLESLGVIALCLHCEQYNRKSSMKNCVRLFERWTESR